MFQMEQSEWSSQINYFVLLTKYHTAQLLQAVLCVNQQQLLKTTYIYAKVYDAWSACLKSSDSDIQRHYTYQSLGQKVR